MTLDHDEILRLPDVIAIIRRGRTWVYEAEARGDFPARVRLGPRAVGWRRSDLLAWMASLPTARDGAA